MNSALVYVLEWRHYEESEALGVFWSLDGAKAAALPYLRPRGGKHPVAWEHDGANEWTAQLGYTITAHPVRP